MCTNLIGIPLTLAINKFKSLVYICSIKITRKKENELFINLVNLIYLKMKNQNPVNLLDNTSNQLSKVRTRKGVEINGDVCET